MSRTTFGGPVRAGTIKDAPFSNVGTMNMSQQATIVALGTDNATSATFYLPAGSTIYDIVTDVTVASDATTATLSVGTTAGGTTYASGVDVKTTGRKNPTFSAAQLEAMHSTATAGTEQGVPYSVVVATITLTGTGTTGNAYVRIRYIQPDDRATAVTY